MASATNSKRQGAMIALMRARRAYEIMNAYQRASVKPSNTKKL